MVPFVEGLDPEDLGTTPSRTIKVQAAAMEGLLARPVVLEASLDADCFGPPRILGLPDAAVREAYFRVLAAFRALNLAFPRGQVVVNLAPARTRKEGSGFDLALALACACLSGYLPPDATDGLLLAGELGLDGSLRPVPGILGLARLAASEGLDALLCPEENAVLAIRASGGVRVVPLRDLSEALRVLQEGLASARGVSAPASPPPPPERRPLARIRGQETALLALQVAAAGGHNLLLSGPPGCGKTLLASSLPALLPPLEEEQALEVLALHTLRRPTPPPEVLALLEARRPPFRAPHHSISQAGLIGGGNPPSPGEASLAHHGVLFLDELPEFSRQALESLRQPLESERILLHRAGTHAEFPASFQLVAAMNPCPCGRLGHPTLPCRDSPARIHRYRSRISGPLLDRIDLQLPCRPVAAEVLLAEVPEDGFESRLRARVLEARARQAARNGGVLNARLDGNLLRSTAHLSPSARRLLLAVCKDGRLSARAIHRLLKVARSLADLGEAARIREEDLATAFHLRLRPAENDPLLS